MRVKNSLKNMVFGLSGQIISLVTGFVVRTVFITTLGIEYLGVNGLFSNILTILSLANLGFDTAIIYSLYKPLAEGDKIRITGLMNLYAKAYRIIGGVVLLIGLSLLPFLDSLMKNETSIDDISIIYILFLANSVLSYFFVYKQSIIIADQRSHVMSKVYSIVTIVSNLFQIVLLVSTKNYLIVLSSQIAIKVLQNIYISHKADKLYPYLTESNNIELSRADKKAFFQNLFSLMLYRISGVVINGTDNIVISKFIGITWVGICDNYLLIITTLNSLLSQIFYSVTASVGNLIVTEGEEKKYLIFRVINFANFWVYGFCSVCLWNLINPLIGLWLGQQYVINNFIVFALILNFYTTGMQNASTTFRETTGLFRIGRKIPVVAALTNIVFSIVFVKTIGVAGVFLGTVISRLCTYFWYDPYILFKSILHKPVKRYYLRYIYFGLLVFLSSLLTDAFSSLFNVQTYLEMVTKGISCLIIPNTIFYILFRKSEEFKFIYRIARQLVETRFPRLVNSNCFKGGEEQSIWSFQKKT